MSLFDYHRRSLSPAIWNSDEMTLAGSVRSQLHSQLDRRFPKATGVYFVGDLVGHYYDDNSVLDILVLAPDDLLPEYQHEAKFVSGYLLKGTEHPVFFHVLSNQLNPNVLADKFGTLYGLGPGSWVGKRVADLTELTRPEAIMQRIRWRLYKAKLESEPYPYTWKVITEAFLRLSDDERQQVLDELQQTATRLGSNIAQVIKPYNSERIWREASTLNQLMVEDADEGDIADFVEASKLPVPVVFAVYNRFRYQDVYEVLGGADEQLRRVRDQDERAKMMKIQVISRAGKSPEKIKYRGRIYRRAS